MYIAFMAVGFVLGIAATYGLLRCPDESEWRQSGNGWKRKRHGNWEYMSN